MAQKDSNVKAFLGVAAPVYLAPLLLIKNLALPCAVLLVVLFTVLETLPLPLVSLVPWAATVLLGHSTSGYEGVLELSSAEVVSLTGFLIVYVLVDSMRLWTKLSALLLRWQGVRVGPLFASLMFVAFTASLVLPATFVTLLLAAFVCRHMDNIKEDVAVLQARLEMPSAQHTRQAQLASKASVRIGEEHLKPRAPLVKAPWSPVTRTASRRASQARPVPERGPSGPLVRVDDIMRQLATAIRSASVDSPRHQFLRFKRRSLLEHSLDMTLSDTSVALHGTTTSVTTRTFPQEFFRSKTARLSGSLHRPRLPKAVLGALGPRSPPLVHRDNVEKTATVVPSSRTLRSVGRDRYNKTESHPKSTQSRSPLSPSQSVDDAVSAPEGTASGSKLFKTGTPPHASQLHNIADVPPGSSSPRDGRTTGVIQEASSKSPSSRLGLSVDQTPHLSLLSPGGSPTLRISCISGAAAHPSNGSPLHGTPPQRANGPPIGESRSALHLPFDASKQSSGPGKGVVERRSRRTSSPRKRLPSPRASSPKQLEPLANPEPLKTAGPCTSKDSESCGQHPSSPSGPASVSSQLSQGLQTGVGSLATPSQIGASGSKLEHPGVVRSYASETERSGHQHTSFAPPDGDDSPELGTHQKSVALNATRSSAPGRKDDAVTGAKIKASVTLYRRIQKVLILGAAYTSIIAGECGFKGRARVIINEYYAKQKKQSPLNTVVFVCCLVPASLVSIMLFLIFTYRFYLRDVDVVPTPELRIALHEIGKERWQHEDRLSMREVMVILLLVAIGISLIVDTDRHIGIDSTTVSSLCAVMAVGIPQTLGYLWLTEHVVTWQLVLRRLPWELILVRLGGSALQVVAERSGVSTWLLETTLLRHVNTRVHPAWCLVGLMAATALVCEVDTGVAGLQLVDKLILLSERIELHPLYFVLPVLMQSRCVLLMPYTSTPLAFLHLYTHMRRAELYWLGLLLKVIIYVAFVVAANTMLFM